MSPARAFTAIQPARWKRTPSRTSKCYCQTALRPSIAMAGVKLLRTLSATMVFMAAIA